MNPTFEEIENEARLHPQLDFYFLQGRLCVSRSPTIRLPVKGTSSEGSYCIADWQPSNFTLPRLQKENLDGEVGFAGFHHKVSIDDLEVI